MQTETIGRAYAVEDVVMGNRYEYAGWFQDVLVTKGTQTPLKAVWMYGIADSNPYYLMFGGGRNLGTEIASNFTSGFAGNPHGSKINEHVGEVVENVQGHQCYTYDVLKEWMPGSSTHTHLGWYLCLNPEWEVVTAENGRKALVRREVNYYRCEATYHPSTDAITGAVWHPISREEYDRLKAMEPDDAVWVTWEAVTPEKPEPVTINVNDTLDEIPF